MNIRDRYKLFTTSWGINYLAAFNYYLAKDNSALKVTKKLLKNPLNKLLTKEDLLL